MKRAMLITPLLAILLCGAGGDRPQVREAVARMQAFYEKTQDLKGKFKQVFTDTLYNSRKTSYGYLYVKKPGMMRWNYVKPERKSFIADGKVLWVWEPEDKQAFRNPLDSASLGTGLTFLLGKGDLTREFEAVYTDAKLGAPGDLVLKLTPKVPTSQYEHLVIAIKPGDYAVGESMVVQKNSTNHFIFSEMKFNTALGGSRFRFTPPEGSRVIDGSKLKR